MCTSALFGAKIIRVFEIYGVSAWTSGGGEGWSIFRDFMRASFMDGP